MPCGAVFFALLELRPRFGLELVRDLAATDGLLTSEGAVLSVAQPAPRRGDGTPEADLAGLCAQGELVLLARGNLQAILGKAARSTWPGHSRPRLNERA